MNAITARMPIRPAWTPRTSVCSPRVASTSEAWIVVRGTGRAPALISFARFLASSSGMFSICVELPLIWPVVR